MGWESSIFLVLLSAGTLLLLGLAVVGWRRRSAPGSYLFSLLMLVMGFWLFAGGLVIYFPGEVDQLFWTSMALLGMTWAAPIWLATLISFLNGDLKIPLLFTRFMLVLPLLSSLLIVTNEQHHLVWFSAVPGAVSWVFPGRLMRFFWGTWFWLDIFYCHLMNLGGFFLIFRTMRRLPPFQRRQVQSLAVGWAVPALLNLAFVTGWSAYPALDPSPLSLLFSGAVFGWSLFRLSLFDPARLARKAVLANLGDGFIALDTRDRVADANRQARRFLGLEHVSIGQPVTQMLRHRPDVLNLLSLNAFIQTDLPAGEDRPVYLEATLAPWYANENMLNGRILILHEVTRRKTLELRLQTHLRQQTFTSDLLQILYRPADRATAISRVLERIGRFAHVDRVFLCQDSPDHRRALAVAVWGANPEDFVLPPGPLLEYDHLSGWASEIEARGAFFAVAMEGTVDDLAEFMRSRGVLTMAAFPVYDHQRLYGYLLLESIARVRVWTVENLELLKNAARILSGAVARWAIEEAEHRQRDLAEALRDMAGVLNSSLNLDEVLDRALESLDRVVPHHATSFALLENDEEVRFVRWRVTGYDTSSIIPQSTVSIRRFMTLRIMADTHKPIILTDTHQSDMWTNIEGDDWVRSYLGVPVQNRGRLVGFINLFSSLPGFFTPEHGDRLRAFADDVALAIENVRLYDETRRRAEEMEILYRIGLILTSGLEMSQVLAALLEECRRILPVDVFYVGIYDEELGLIHHPMFWEQGQLLQIESRSIIYQPGLSGEVIQTRRTLYLPDTLAPGVEQRYHIIRSGGEPARSYVGVPLLVRDQVVGVLSMQSYQPGDYSPDQIRLLETIATQAAVAVENARVFEQMRQMAITDPVTQLNTRRHFTALAHAEVNRAVRYGRELSVLMVDIDRFKRVNDTWGHNAGDLVLQAIAQQCRQALRQTDLLGRWGGEEFAVILPETGEAVAQTIGERIRKSIESTEIPVMQGTIQVTVSIGLTSLREDCKTLEEMVDCADQALYMAKEAGRNRVRVWEK